MSQFEGFPSRMQFTAVPNLFINKLMAEIDDICELKVTLHIFRIIYTKKGSLRFVTKSELQSDSGVTGSLGEQDGASVDLLERALEKAVQRGTILCMDFENIENTTQLYFINTENDKKTVEKIRNGSIEIQGLSLVKNPVAANSEPIPDIFTLYEENIGMLTPMVAESMKEAEKNYPASWIRDAIKEAVSLNKRNWRYIDRILENWSAEGRGDGTHRRNNQTDPGKYRKQKYDHLVKR